MRLHRSISSVICFDVCGCVGEIVCVRGDGWFVCSLLLLCVCGIRNFYFSKDRLILLRFLSTIFFNYLLFLLYKTIDTNDVLFFSFPFLLSLETITHEQYLNT